MADKKKKGGFQYQPRNVEAYQKRATSDGMYDKYIKPDFKLFSCKEDGKYQIRIMPPTWEDAGHFGHDIYVVHGVGPDKQAYLSLKRMKGQRDPMEEERLRAKSDGRDEDARELEARQRLLCFVIDRKNEDEGPKLWAMPRSVDKEICLLAQDETTGGVLNIDDPNDGYDIYFTKEGKGLKTRYTGFKLARRESPLSSDDDTQKEWLDYVSEHPVPSTLKFYSYDHIKEVLDGGGSPDKGEDDDGDKPAPKKRSRAADDDDDDAGTSKKSSKQSPASDDEDDDDDRTSKKRSRDADDDDDATDKRPARRQIKDEIDDDDDDRSSKKRSRDTDDDDDDKSGSSDDDDDDNDKKPSKPTQLKKRSRDDDDDDDADPPAKKRATVDDDDDDDGDRPAPAKRSSSAAKDAGEKLRSKQRR